MIAIIDYGAGNLGSVKKAFDYLGVTYRVVDSGDQLGSPSGVVLPGVGAFGVAVEKLRAGGFFPVLREYIAKGGAFLGICLGMQLLMESSAEDEGIEGLAVVPGTCRRFKCGKVPQMGWNRVRPPGASSTLLTNIDYGSYFYFIHSYYVETECREVSTAQTDYFIPFTSIIEQGRVCGVQFHPEKSGDAGMQLLKNWLDFYVDQKEPVERKRGATVRIIPCLDVDNGRVVKGVNFKHIRDAGDPVELATLYNEAGADEITFLDIGATYKSREILLDVVEKVSRQVFVPLAVGGGIGSVDDMRRVLHAGADKVSVCSSAIKNPSLLTEGARVFGSQCIVLSIDAGRVGDGDRWHAYVNGGRVDSGVDALEWAKRGEALGAGEILLNSIDRDGTQQGYDLELTRRVSESVNIPVIASGGAGTMDHMKEAVEKGKADAVLLASLLHDKQMRLEDVKLELRNRGVNVRW